MSIKDSELRRLLKHQRLSDLNALLDIIFRESSRRAREKRVAIDRLFEAPGGVAQIVAAIQSRARKGFIRGAQSTATSDYHCRCVGCSELQSQPLWG